MPNLPPLPRPRLRRPQPVGDLDSPGGITALDDPKVVEASGLRWIHIEDPRLAHREWLEQHYDFHPLDWEDVYSRNQRSKLDVYDDYLFLVMHFPFFEKASGRLLTAEVDLFVGPDYLITMTEHPLPPLQAMFERMEQREELRE